MWMITSVSAVNRSHKVTLIVVSSSNDLSGEHAEERLRVQIYQIGARSPLPRPAPVTVRPVALLEY